uniref:Transthyretin-like family protein n=1 Tax=Elaeophora elaphi TaxID=1147741 RepID=A0A0R3RMT2_9BILA
MWLVFSLSAYIVIGMVHTANAFLEQSVRVRGRLLCGSQPASSILVKLFDKDNGPNPDDLMASCYTDSGGKFDLQGNSYELSTIDPEVRIYHDCNDYGRPCQREWVIRVPDRYVSSGAVARKIMELGEMNLEVELENEDQECIHQ